MPQRVRAMETTSAAPRQAGLTRLRFCFIAWVILFHLNLTLHVDVLWPDSIMLLGRGYLGVDGFFLLSGFALWLGYGARPPWGWAGVRVFLLRRISKIWPLHALALLALALLVMLAGVAGLQVRDPQRFGAGDFVLQLFLLNAWETSRHWSWNYPSWALSVEWAGYLAFPLVLRAVLALPPALLWPLAPVLAAGLWALERHVPGAGLNWTLHLGLVRFGLEFGLGLVLGRLATLGRLPPALPRLALVLLPVGLALGTDTLTVLGLAALVVAAWQSGRAVPAPAPAPARPDLLVRLGEASFGVYLCWVFIEAALVVVLRLTEPGPVTRLGLMLAGFVASLIAGWLAWRLVEVPAQRWVLRRFGSAASVEQRLPGRGKGHPRRGHAARPAR